MSEKGFKPSELKMGYVEWTRLVKDRRAQDAISPDVLAWLAQWESIDLSCSPMNDTERRFTRYGHYMGWFQATKGDAPAP